MTNKITKYSSDNPNPIDKYVGSRIRQRRTLLGYSQEKLADALGITFQQVQKYENATNRVGASRLWDIANILGVETSFFYNGLMVDANTASCDVETAIETSLLNLNEDKINSKESLKLLRYYHTLPEEIKTKFYELLKVTSKENFEFEEDL